MTADSQPSNTPRGLNESAAPSALLSEPAVGIDLGTSTSSVAVFRDGEAELIADENGDIIIPSAVQLALGNEIVVGSPAKNSAVTQHDRTILEVKRLMGTNEPIKLGPRTFTPEDISALLLEHLKRAAEDHLKTPVRDVVLSVPARFENEAREATRRAAEKAGLNVVRLINEPTAAALSYGLNRLQEKQKVLVFDFGGGTLDVTVLEMFEGVLDVRTSVGDDRLGGKDIDEVIVQILRDAFRDQHGKKLPAPSRDRRAAQRLKQAAENAKKALTGEDAALVDLPDLIEELGLSYTLTRETVENRMEEMLMRAMALVNEALSRARMRWSDIDVVLPVGGSSRIPLFRRALEFAWGRPIEERENPDEAVVRGAAIAADIELSVKQNNRVNQALLVLDVSPHRLGVATIKQVGNNQFVDDYFSEIIPKDAKLPAHQQREYVTSFHGAEPITVRVYEASSDSNLCRDHRLVSELLLRNLSPDTDNEPVQVDFTYTLDGTLDVSVRYISVPSVRIEGRYTVLGGMGGVNGAGMADPNVSLDTWRETPQADMCAPMLDQAERLEQARPDSAPTIRVAADSVKRALVANDKDRVRRALDELTDLLFELV